MFPDTKIVQAERKSKRSLRFCRGAAYLSGGSSSAKSCKSSVKANLFTDLPRQAMNPGRQFVPGKDTNESIKALFLPREISDCSSRVPRPPNPGRLRLVGGLHPVRVGDARAGCRRDFRAAGCPPRRFCCWRRPSAALHRGCTTGCWHIPAWAPTSAISGEYRAIPLHAKIISVNLR